MLRFILAGMIIFSVFSVGLAEETEGLFNPSSNLRMPASNSIKLDLKADLKVNTVNPTSFATTRLEKTDNPVSATFDLFSAVKKVFFGIISALGIDVTESKLAK